MGLPVRIGIFEQDAGAERVAQRSVLGEPVARDRIRQDPEVRQALVHPAADSELIPGESVSSRKEDLRVAVLPSLDIASHRGDNKHGLLVL